MASGVTYGPALCNRGGIEDILHDIDPIFDQYNVSLDRRELMEMCHHRLLLGGHAEDHVLMSEIYHKNKDRCPETWMELFHKTADNLRSNKVEFVPSLMDYLKQLC